ncbi:uncharacterized protein B0H18DRAFT_835948, partial [Fomitopsis serialis]
RFVVESVGTPLAKFGPTKELVEAIRDALLGHKRAFDAGVLHCDVSEGNVLLCRHPSAGFKGFLHDLD